MGNAKAQEILQIYRDIYAVEAQASQYSTQHWEALTRYLDDPDFEIDNNHSERAIKDFILARKNFLFLGSQSGGNAAAICLSILASQNVMALSPGTILKMYSPE